MRSPTPFCSDLTRAPLMSRLCLSLIALSGCGDQTSGYDPSASTISADRSASIDRATRTQKADEWRELIPTLNDEDVVVARITLGEARGESIEVEDEFLGQFQQISPEINSEIEGDIKEGLKGTFAARRLLSSGESGFLRRDRFLAQGDINAQKLTQDLAGLFKSIPLLPFKLTADAEVSFSRLFDDQEAADQAPLLTPLNLPFSLDRALALPQGTVVQVPVEAQMSLNLNGQHLSRSWGYIHELSQMLKSSASGFTSAAIQGVLMMSGSFTITVTRHHDQLIRVLVQRRQERRSGGAIDLGAEVTFFPAATVDRLRSLRDRLIKWGKRPAQHLKSWGDRLKELRSGVSEALRPLLDESRVESYPEPVRRALEFAESHVDPALDMLEQGEASLDVASAWIEEQLESTLGAADPATDPISYRVKRHSERAFNTRLAVQLSAKSSEQVGILGDYLIDLSSESGVIAFEAILSGRARWEGLTSGSRGDLGLIDLTLVDGLVSEGVEGVRCLRRAELKTQKKRVKINIHSPFSSWRFAAQQQDHDLDVEIDGRQERWVAEQWSVNRGLSAIDFNRNETLLSGQLAQLPTDQDDEGEVEGTSTDAEWAYWMSWSKQWPKRASSPVREAFSEALNLSGSVGISQGLAQHFFADAAGALNVQFTLVFYQGFLNELMERAEPDLIWEAAALTAERFDDRSGPPYALAFRDPELSDRAAAACDIITLHWGKRYCRIIHYDLIKPLLEIRDSSASPEERRRAQRDWLASLYERRFFFNPIGARLTVRLLCELATLLGRQDEVSLRLRLEHPDAPEVGLNLSLEGGLHASADHPIHALEIAEWLGLGEGITYWP